MKGVCAFFSAGNLGCREGLMKHVCNISGHMYLPKMACEFPTLNLLPGTW